MRALTVWGIFQSKTKVKILKMRFPPFFASALITFGLVAGGNSYATDCAHLAIPDGLENAMRVQEQSSMALSQRMNGQELDLVDDGVAEKLAPAKRAYERCQYLVEYKDAITLEKIRAFEIRYAGNDPDGLIEKLAATKRQLKTDRYHQGFASMSEISDLEAFIADYANDDPDGKVPEVRHKLTREKLRVAAEAKKAAEEKAASDKAKAIADVERQIIWCKRQSISAYQAIDREKQIERVSGIVNKMVLRQAGELIVACEESIPNNFAEYKRLGGTKTLAQLK